MHRFVEICAHVCRVCLHVSVRISTNSLWVLQGSIRWFRIVDKEDGHGFSCLSPCCWVCLWVCVCYMCMSAGSVLVWGRDTHIHWQALSSRRRSICVGHRWWIMHAGKISTSPSLPEREKEREWKKCPLKENKMSLWSKEFSLSSICVWSKMVFL